MISTTIFYLLIFVFGATIGSFLNVVIYRLPMVLNRQWRNECLTYLKQPTNATEQKFNLMYPRSHCPACNHLLAWWHNIPLLSYLLLAGKCNYCQKSISLRYPVVELLSAVMSCGLIYYYGLHVQAYAAILFSWLLIVIIFIDLDHMIIPDQLNLPLLWLGLLVNCFYTFSQPSDAIIGAAAGYIVLWLIMAIYKLLTKKVSIGHGDFKLFAALGAWLGWQLLPLTLFFAAFLGSIVGVILILLKKHQREKPLPFGPYLAIAGWIVLLWGNHIMSWYYINSGLL